MNATDSLAYLQAHSARAKVLDRMTLDGLHSEDRAAAHRTGLQRLTGWPVSRDELVNEILALDFPEISTARTVYAASI
jgi:hypothetical protein